MNLLIVEDSDDDVLLTVAALRRAGVAFEYTVVASTEALREAVAQNRWQAVISDYSLQGFTGLDALRIVRDHLPEVPFLLVSGVIGEERAVDAIRAGANDCITKDRIVRLAPALERELREVEQRAESRRLGEALRTVEERYRKTFEKAPIGICHGSADSRFIAVNERFCEIVGRPREQLIGQQIAEFGHPDDRDLAVRMMADVVSGRRRDVTFDRRYVRPDGGVVCARVTLAPAFTSGGTFDYMIALVEDITAQQAGDERLALQAQLLDSVEQAVIATDSQNRVTFWNRFAEELYGYRAEEVLGLPLGRCGPVFVAEAGFDTDAFFEAAESRTGELTVITRGERRFTASVVHSPVMTSNGSIAGFVLVSHDITRKKRTESELLSQRAQLADAQSIARLGSWDHDLATGRRVWSAELFNVLGLEPGPIPTLEQFFAMIHPDDRARVTAVYRDWSKSMKALTCEFRIARPDGNLRYMSLRKRVERDAAGQAIRAIGVVQDITETKAIEHELTRAAVRQAVIANLGQLALSGASLGFLITQAVESSHLLEIECLDVLRTDGDGVTRIASFGCAAPADTRDAGRSEAAYTIAAEGRVVITDLQQETRFTPSPFLLENGIASGVLVTIDAGEAEPWGVLAAYSRTAAHFTITDADFLRAAATMLGQAIERSRTEDELRRRAAQQSAIAELGRLALTSLHEPTFERARELVKEGLGVEFAKFADVAPGGEFLLLRGTSSARELPSQVEIKPDYQSGLTVITGEPVIVEDFATDSRFQSRAMFERLGVTSSLMVPVRSASATYGVLAAMSAAKRRFSEADVHFVQSLANIVAEAMERDRTRAEIADSEARYRSVIEGASEVIFTADVSRRILTLNAAWAEMTGWAAEEWIGRNFAEAIVETDRERAMEAHRTMLQTRRRTAYHAWIYGRSSRLLLDITWFPRIVDDEIVAVYGFARDVTEHHLAEEERQRLTRSLQLLLESTVEGIFTVDVEGRCTMLNRAAAEVLGRSAAELLGQPMQPLLNFIDGERDATPILDVLRDGAARMIPNGAVTRPDGSVVPIEYSAAAIFDGGIPAGAVVSFTDISARRRLEAQLEQANRLTSLGRLAATVAHEFNNVLMGIAPFVELLRRNNDPARVASALDHIGRSVVRGKRITEDILRFTQPAEPVRTAIDVEPWLRNMALEARSLLPERFRVEVEGDGSLRLDADPTQLHQILINLILNARDAMPEGGRIVVNVRRELPTATFAFGVVDRPETFAHFIVCDEGCGMTPEVRHHIFEPLFTTKKSGTGLGLAVTHQVVRRHGGAIFAESTAGKGSTFHIFLPLASADGGVGTGGNPGSSRPAGRELLLVEDDRGVSAGLMALLELEGFHVEVAETGAEALKLLEFKRPDAVLLDVDLPDGDGTSVYASIAAMHPALPVIFSTGHADRAELEVLLSLPNISYLLKPYELEALLDVLAEVIH